MTLKLSDISIRTQLKSGDIGQIIYLHGRLYNQEFGYGLDYENYVTQAFSEFYSQYDDNKDCIWIAEYNEELIGTLSLMHRENMTAQLRFFLVLPEYRNLGLGKHLMNLFMADLKNKKYACAYLWTAKGLSTAAALYQKHGFEMTAEKASNTFGKRLYEQRYDLWL